MERPTRRRRGCSAYRASGRRSQQLLTLLADHSAAYLIRQIEAGADAVQIFDSWAGVLDEASFEAYCVEPVARDRPAGARSLSGCADHRLSQGRRRALRRLSPEDRCRRRSGSTGRCRCRRQRELQDGRRGAGQSRSAAAGRRRRGADDGVDAILRALGDGPLVFNLGHGITPETPIEHVEAMIARMRKEARDDER